MEPVPGPAHALVQLHHEVRLVGPQESHLLVPVADQPLEPVPHGVEVPPAGCHALGQVGRHRLAVPIELDGAVRGEEVQLCVQRVGVLAFADPPGVRAVLTRVVR